MVLYLHRLGIVIGMPGLLPKGILLNSSSVAIVRHFEGCMVQFEFSIERRGSVASVLSVRNAAARLVNAMCGNNAIPIA